MSAITAKASRKMKKYAVLTRGAVALRISAQLLFLQTETASTRKLLAVGVKYKYATT